MLDELRRKPKHVRDRYAFFGALFVTLCIAMVWFVALGVRYSAPTSDVASSSQNVRSEYSSVWTTFTHSIGQAFSRFQNMNTATTSVEEEVSASTTASSSPSAIDRAIDESFNDLNRRKKTRTVQIATSSKNMPEYTNE